MGFFDNTFKNPIKDGKRLLISRNRGEGVYIDSDYLVYLYQTDADHFCCLLNNQKIIFRQHQPTVLRDGKYSVEFFFWRKRPSGTGGQVRLAICAPDNVRILRDEIAGRFGGVDDAAI